MNLINKERLDAVTAAAQASERLRMNYNYHDDLEAPAQRLLNALEPGTLLPIHRHHHSAETYILLRGKMEVVYYNDQKEETERVTLDPLQGNYGVHIPIGQWHTLEVLESGSVLFEIKEGPYTPLAEGDILE